MEQRNAALRPLTLPSLPPDLSRLSEFKAQLAQLHSDIQRYEALERKLDGFTDQPTWNAYIPFGPLAYFPGKLVHTNDITQTLLTAPPSGETSQNSSGGRADAGTQVGDGSKVLRSAKQAREEAQRLRTELASKIVSLEQEIAAKEAELKTKREAERKLGKGGSEGAMAAMGDNDDWTINERGEVINEEGLPMFDIREELPLSPEPSPSAASASRGPDDGIPPRPKQMRYLIKKGGKQVVRPLAAPAPSVASPLPPAPRPSPAPISSPVLSPIAEPGPKLDVKSILDELEAEEKAEREAREAREMEEREKEVALEVDGAPEGRIFEMAADEKAASPAPASAPAPATSPSPQPFAGFSAGFLSKSKQKRPSNSLVTPPPPSAASTAPPAPSPAPTPATAPAPALKSSLSRPASPSRSNNNNTTKRVAFELPVPDSEVPTRESKSKAAPIILGMGPLSDKEEANARPVPEKQEEGKKEPFVRPIKEMVIERPMKKVVPPGGGKGEEGKKKVSRFRKGKEAEEGGTVMEKAGAVEQEKEDPIVDKGKGKERVSNSSLAQEQQQQEHDVPAPIHTISLSSKPSASSSSSSTARADGTISYADIAFDSSEEDPDSMDVDSDEFAYSDEDDFDEEDFDVDAALHQREVALAYHRQRLGVGAGYGTGALGGYHAREASPFGATEQGLVPADATIDSLSSPLTHASAFGKPSRFRTANKHLESASLIIPSLVAADPTLTTSQSPLGPAPDDEDERRGEDDLDEKEQERLRRTLEALAEGRPLPEDEQVLEREKEVRLREELMKEKMEEQRRRDMALQRSAGKAPPSIVPVPRNREREKEAVVIPVPGNEPRGEVSTKEQQEEERREEERREEMRRELEKMTVETAGEGEGAKPKRMSRFRQKQLGLVD
ncbi:hypothetical protein JCM21900_004603 [Sporobolomyces salmonicolor]